MSVNVGQSHRGSLILARACFWWCGVGRRMENNMPRNASVRTFPSYNIGRSFSDIVA